MEKPPTYDESVIPWTAILAVLNSPDRNLTKQRLEKELKTLEQNDERTRLVERIQGKQRR